MIQSLAIFTRSATQLFTPRKQFSPTSQNPETTTWEEVLDEQIENANKQAKGKGRLQWTNLCRDLIAERNATLAAIKGHLLGRTEVGSINEPEKIGANPEVEFERTFQRMLHTLDSVRLATGMRRM